MNKPARGNALVFGGTGSIGGTIAERLLKARYNVWSISRGLRKNHHDGIDHKKSIMDGPTWRNLKADVTKPATLTRLFNRTAGKVSVLVYAVGDCPPSAFDDQVSTPMLRLSTHSLAEELALHVTGLHNVLHMLRMSFEIGAHIVVIGSAITRLNDEACPIWLHAGHYATAKAAQREYLTWLRRDDLVLKNDLLIHNISPAAVDTPFHQECEHQPAKLVSVKAVCDKVMEALRSDYHTDAILLPG